MAFPSGERPAEAARVVVRVEDVSRADAPSVTVGQNVLEQVQLPPGEAPLPFEIRLPRSAIDPKKHYSLRIHVDVNGSGAVTSGDFMSTTAYPLAFDQPQAQQHSQPQGPRQDQSPAQLAGPTIQVRRI